MKTTLRLLRPAAALLTLLLLPQAYPAQSGPSPQAVSQQGGWDDHVVSFREQYFRLRPDMAVLLGRHDFDGQIPDFSKEGLKAYTEFLKQARRAARKQPVKGRQQEFELEHLHAIIDGELFWIETAELPFTNPLFYVGPGVDPTVYFTREYAPLEVRLRGLTRHLANMPTALHQMRSNLRTPLPRTFVSVGRIIFGGLATTLENDVPRVFEPVRDPQLQEQYRKASAAAVVELKALDNWLEEQARTANDAFALGPARFKRMLWETERVRISLDKLERIARSDLARNVAALKEACAKVAPGKSVAECLQIVNATKPADGVLEAARRQLADLKRFVVTQDLVTIPGEEEALVADSPPHMRWNSASLNPPGPFDRGVPATYYITPPDPGWTAQEKADYMPSEGNLLFTSVHEVWPGHFLHLLHLKSCRSVLGQVFLDYAFIEGWAHYTEEMMWEAGLGNQDPTAHIGQLAEALLRDARFISAIGLHRGTMTVAQSEELFRTEAFTDAANARQQAARGTFDPGYLNYTLGKLMIRKLRDDWCRTRGGRKAWKQFHDEFLAFGNAPIPLVRKAMLGDSDHLF